MRPYALELRTRIVEAYENKEGSVRDLADRFAVAPNTVQNYLNLRRETGRLEPRPLGGGGAESLINKQTLPDVRRLVEEYPDASELELAREFKARYHILVSRATMGRVLRRLGLTRKKNAPRQRAGHPEGPRRA